MSGIFRSHYMFSQCYSVISWRWLSWGIIIAVILGTLVACGSLGEEESPFGDSFGTGSTGEAVGSNLTTVTLVASDGDTLGSFQYDTDYYVDVSTSLDPSSVRLSYLFNCPPTVDPTTLTVSDCTASHNDAVLTLEMFQISGLPATPCRFQAAQLARDEDYDVGDFGDVDNANGLTFHQVNVSKPDSVVHFYCTTLKGKVGVMIRAESAIESMLDSFQLLAVLNSLRK